MPVELHLPDLPEVPISLGPTPGLAVQGRQPWHLRLRDLLSSYLPLLLMGLLAFGTWWLVKNTPSAPAASAPSAVRSDPDYTMTQFAIERFDKTGQLRMRVDGERLRHFPDNGRIEIDGARIRAVAPDGRVTLAVADRALANNDVTEVQLLGGAQVTSQGPQGRPVRIRSEFLHAFLATERIITHLPVHVTDGLNALSGDGLVYDNGRRHVELTGRVRALFEPASTQP